MIRQVRKKWQVHIFEWHRQCCNNFCYNIHTSLDTINHKIAIKLKRNVINSLPASLAFEILSNRYLI